MSPVSGFILFSLLITFAYLLGLLVFITDYDENKCEMTYMFEYPQYVRISHPHDKFIKKYELYVYSEGRITEKARNMYFDGIPVLFIPGNGGSYKQVRSLASVALRKALNSRTRYHFDYFMINLNEELNGLNGALLHEQTNYINQSIYRILELYSNRKNPQKSVILVGHSMGGIIARTLAYSTSDPNLIPLVLTLASPHKRPPLLLDQFMNTYYNSVHSNGSVETNTTFISISGGHADFLISPMLTNIKENKSLSVVTSDVPLVWMPADHVCILWCKQLILAINRALFEIVNPATKQVTDDADFRLAVFRHHLTHHSGIKTSNINSYDLTTVVDLDHNGKWIQNINRQYTIELKDGLREQQWYMVNLVNLPNHEMLTILAINLEVVDWVYACSAHIPIQNHRKCVNGVHLTHLSEIAPSVKYKRRTFSLNMHEFMNNNSRSFSHVVFRARPTDEPVVFHVDIYNSAERKLSIDLPKWFSMSRQVIVPQTVEKAVHYTIILQQLQHVMQSYLLLVEPLKCQTQFHHAHAKLRVPWAHQSETEFFTDTAKKPLHIRLYSSKPATHINHSATVEIILDPNCSYKISIKSSQLGLLGQLARYYSPLLLANIAAVVLMTLRAQLRTIGEKRYCSIFFLALNEGAKPYYVLTSVKLVSRLSSINMFSKFIPQPDYINLAEDNLDFFLLPLLLYITSVGIVWMCAIGLGVSLIVCESTVNKVALKFLAKSVTFTMQFSDYLLSALHKLPFVVAGVLIFISLTTCGSLALCVGAVFYFLKLTQLSQEYVEEVVWYVVKNAAKTCKGWFCKQKSDSTPQNNEAVEIVEQTEQIPEIEPPKSNDSVKKNDVVVKSKNEDEENDNLNGEISNDESSGEENEEENIELEQIKNVENKENELRIEQINESGLLEEPTEKGDDPDKKDNGEENVLSSHNSVFFHATLFLIWCIITVINLPSVLTWAHNFKFTTMLQPDPSFLPGLLLSICSFPLWQFDLPRTDRTNYEQISSVIMVLAIIGLIYAPISVYRLSYTLTIVIVIVTLHQIFAPKRTDIAEEGADGTNTEPDRYEQVKAKWE